MKISLVGFMGTGKTTVGKKLADKLNLEFLETDSMIEDKTKKSIPEIFSQNGEDYFRTQEKNILNKIIDEKENFVLSTGGGIVISPQNRQLLKNRTHAILLKASPEVIYQRTKNDEARPLLQSDNPLQKIKKLLEARQDYYQQFFNKIDTDHKNPKKIVKEIINLLGINKV